MSLDGEDLRLSVGGSFQIDNLSTAATTFDILISLGWADRRSSVSGVEQLKWPGRFELIRGCPSYLLDVAHNELAFIRLRDSIMEQGLNKIALVFGVSEEPKLAAGLTILSSIASRIFLTTGYDCADSRSRSFVLRDSHCRLPDTD